MAGKLSSALMSVALLCNRLALGMFFLIAGYHKVFGPGGVSAFYENGFKPMTPPWLPQWFAVPYGHAIPFLEMIVGGLLILGLCGRITATIAFLMLTSFTIAMVTKSGISGGTGAPFSPTFIYMAAMLVLAVAGSGGISIDRFMCKSCQINLGGSGKTK